MDKSSDVRSCRVHIQGMTCTACSTTIESSLRNINGVRFAAVGLATQVAEIEYDANMVALNQLIQAIDDMGFEASIISTGENTTNFHLKLESPVEKELLQTILGKLQGIQDIEIDQSDKTTLVISYSPDVIGPRKIISAVESSGLKASLVDEREKEARLKNSDVRSYYRSFLWSLVFAIPMLLLSMVFMYIPSFKAGFLDKKVVNMLSVGEVLRCALSTPVQFIIGWRFYVGAYKAVKLRSTNMDCLVAVGTNTSYFYSIYVIVRSSTSKRFDNEDFFETATMLISLILLGKYLVALAKGKTSDAISKLVKLTPEMARLAVFDDSGRVIGEETIDRRLVEKGDVVKVLPGEKVSVDGTVVMGESHVDESMVTGESRRVRKRVGDEVIGGTMNGSGVLHVRVTCIGSETVLARIIQLVEGAQIGKAPVQKLADRISKYFVPVVICSGIATWLGWYVAGILEMYPRNWVPGYMDRFEMALQFGISVVVVACPCALGLATPTAVMVGTGVGASHGVLLKSGQALESAHKVNCVVFDKTGTLTMGKPTVVGTKLLMDISLPDFYKLVAATEVNSEHPLGKAMVEHAKTLVETQFWPEAHDFEAITGHGVKAMVCKKSIVIGNNSLMQQCNIEIPREASNYMDESQKLGQTAVLVSVDKDVVGVIAVSDPVKPEASGIISILRRMGLKSLMVTGDSMVTANAVAKEVKTDFVVAEAKPEDKARKVGELQKEGFIVAMVGDGINDSPALAVADVGVAIGAGSDIAIEAANVVLMRSSLEGVITAIDLSRKTFNRIKLNYVWALAYNVMAIPLAAGAFFPFTGFRVPPWIAGAAMGASSVSVVCSSLLLKYYRRPSDLDLLEFHEVKVE
ncbi:PREDICTED: probable copper-transporting ATPase HMA5 [Nelumbo nucifera]|uniref:P-type Cu(+) transporter n=1 Tax=Nelumbo nucifera TaxID=4432 RepID=A0A1U8A4L9_NELNU|nr:PREDICTED: probable copper-transporting ATPase HMA5 [Nelumbo nucifera]